MLALDIAVMALLLSSLVLFVDSAVKIKKGSAGIINKITFGFFSSILASLAVLATV